MTFEGYWAEFTDKTANIFRHGTVSGMGRWVKPEKDMAVNLLFTSAQEGSQWTRSFTLAQAKDPLDERAFVRDLESADAIQALLYAELAGRQAPWLAAIETGFLANVTPMVSVPFLGAAQAPFTVDGRLDEPAWQPPMGEDPLAFGCLPGTGSKAPSRMCVRCDAEGLYVGLHVERPLHNPRILLVLLNRFGVPMARSPRWFVQVDGSTITVSQLTRDGRPTSSDCRWDVAQMSSGSAWEAEIRIPFASLDGAAKASHGDRWRLNCEVSEVNGDKATLVNRWGNNDPAQIEHGILLVFGDMSESRGAS